MSQPDQNPLVEVAVLEEEAVQAAWSVILFNDEIHTFEEVILQIIRATGCSMEKAQNLTWHVHHDGEALVFEGEFQLCFRVEGVLSEIGLITQILG